MSAARTSTSQSSVSRSIACTAVVRIGLRSSRGLSEAAAEKLSEVPVVTGVEVAGIGDLQPKNGCTIVTVDCSVTVDRGVEACELEAAVSDVVAVNSLQVDE